MGFVKYNLDLRVSSRLPQNWMVNKILQLKDNQILYSKGILEPFRQK